LDCLDAAAKLVSATLSGPDWPDGPADGGLLSSLGLICNIEKLASEYKVKKDYPKNTNAG
jgi:hypothetical protein